IAKEFFGVNIVDELKTSYMDYAMSVIISRALPDVRDGLKPVQRRILAAMNDLNLVPSASHRKSAKIAGDTSGNYHPHGEAIIYPTMVRMAQVFNARYPLIDAQGNMGSIDGDPPAAMRYTEMRMSKFAVEMLQDLDKDTVDWEANYDQSRMEPLVLPARLPNLLANGSSGIAVGMATNIPPHNLGELCDGLIYLIDNPDCEVSQIMQYVKGPDFPTHGIIRGTDGIKQAYETGRGSILMEARTEIEHLDNGKTAIIVTELPYQVNKTALIEKIAHLAKEKRVDGITDIPDYSDRNGMRIQIELRKDAQARKILNYLFKHTDLRKSFGVNMLALVNGAPNILNLKQVMSYYLEHRYDVVVRRTRHELRLALRRAHIVEGLLIAIDNIDDVVSIIRSAPSAAAARDQLMARFGLTWQQATAILDMQLRQLAGLERGKLEEENVRLLKSIAAMEDLLSEDYKIFNLIKDELRQVKAKNGDARRTKIGPPPEKETELDSIPKVHNIVTLTKAGYVKRMSLSEFHTQGRGGIGIKGFATKDGDHLTDIFIACTHDTLLFFTDSGKLYKLRAHEIPQGSRTAQGSAAINLINIEPGESIVASLVLKNEDYSGFMILATEKGEVKRIAMSNFRNIRSNGLKVFDVEEGDTLHWVEVSDGDRDVILITAKGKSIRFYEEEVRSSGRVSGGVRGIRLDEDDKVVGMTLSRENGKLLCVTENGLGKQTSLDEYRVQSRGGKGIKALKETEKTGRLVGAVSVEDSDSLLVVSSNKRVIIFEVSDIRETGRATQGVRVMKQSSKKAADEPPATVISIERLPNRLILEQLQKEEGDQENADREEAGWEAPDDFDSEAPEDDGQDI
ncbi:MAG: DNA gyrase subunit A, partial [Abditibacteriota bacterium]|nr:DNA gyrase subunit A [Abditibacteriota bacterium]